MLLIRLYDMSKPCIHTPQFTVLLVSFQYFVSPIPHSPQLEPWLLQQLQALTVRVPSVPGKCGLGCSNCNVVL